MNKLRYFLTRFKDVEWSGPAWFSEEFDDNGFPTNVTLEFFHPIDLGHGTVTEWDGKVLLKEIKPLMKKHKEIGTTWTQGNIHSHHKMGAFFSGTDEKQLEDGAFPDFFYYSLVVSSKPDQTLAFACSWVDQYGKIHIEETEDFHVDVQHEVNPEWKKQAAKIKKLQKKIPTRKTNGYASLRGDVSQRTLWEDDKDDKKKLATNRSHMSQSITTKTQETVASRTNGWGR